MELLAGTSGFGIRERAGAWRAVTVFFKPEDAGWL
jgi:hypothetical protein